MKTQQWSFLAASGGSFFCRLILRDIGEGEIELSVTMGWEVHQIFKAELFTETFECQFVEVIGLK